MLSVEETTLDSYESFVRNHIRPLIGDVPLGRISGEVLDRCTGCRIVHDRRPARGEPSGTGALPGRRRLVHPRRPERPEEIAARYVQFSLALVADRAVSSNGE
jgi:hypothetical protein